MTYRGQLKRRGILYRSFIRNLSVDGYIVCEDNQISSNSDVGRFHKRILSHFTTKILNDRFLAGVVMLACRYVCQLSIAFELKLLATNHH